MPARRTRATLCRTPISVDPDVHEDSPPPPPMHSMRRGPTISTMNLLVKMMKIHMGEMLGIPVEDKVTTPPTWLRVGRLRLASLPASQLVV